MDFGRGLSIPEEKDRDLQIQGGAWIPVTPTEQPNPSRLQQIQAERQQASQLGRTNWLESLGFPAGFSQGTSSANGAAACVDSMASLGQSRRRLGNWESGLLVDSHTEAMRNVTAGQRNIPFVDLLALTSGASVASSSAGVNMQVSHNAAAASSPFFPFWYSANNHNQRQPDSASMLLAEQDRSLNCEFWNKSNCQPQLQNGFPVHHHSYDLNSLPKTISDCVSNVAMSIGFEPVTPDKEGKSIQNQLSERADPSVGERLYKEHDKQEVFVTTNGNEMIELNSGGCSQPMSCMNEVVDLQSELSHPLVDTSVAVSTTLEENHNLGKAGDNGIDLNKTPQQKPKRKKHRPKVVIEGKKPRTPKTVATKQANDKENPSGKRKYVRKKSLKTSETPSPEAVEAIEPSPSLTVKSCRRVLNFDLEDQGRDENPCKSLNTQEGLLLNSVERSSSRWIFNLNSESQAQDLSNGIDGGSGTKSTAQLGQGIEVIVNNTSGGIVNDVNGSLPKTTAPAPQSTRRDSAIESSYCLPNNRSEMEKLYSSLSNGENSHPLIHQHAQAQGISRMVFQTTATLDHNEKGVQSQHGSQSMSKCQNDPNGNLHVPFVENEQARGSKREYSHIVDNTHAQTMNMRGVQPNSLQAYEQIPQGSGCHRNNPDLSSPEICKKRRTEKAHYTTTPNGSPSTAANRIGWGQALQNYHGIANTDFNDILGTKGPKNGTSKSVQNVYADSMVTENCPVQNSSKDSLSLSRETFAEQQTSGFMLNFGLTEMTTKKRSKGSTRTRDPTSLTAITQCTQLPSTPQKTAPTSGDGQGTETVQRPEACLGTLIAENYAKKKRTRKATPPLNTVYSSVNQVHLQENKTAMYDQQQRSVTSRGQSEITQQYMVPIDEIIQRLKNLYINGETNRIPGPEQNALVPYNGNSTMVPYEGLFDPTKKRRPRPKVDLDFETNRVWKLLMGKDDSEGMEQMNKDKEKWWEEERRVFRGRADSFIARMHLVQGDRRFSRWKGSVLDSVIGVFLTQNVSDHLSSSAFMSLAAKFPLQSKSNERACCKEGIKTSLEELEVCIIEAGDTIKWREKMPSQLVCDQSSMAFHESGHTEEREVANSNESFGSNMGDGSSTDNSRGKQSPVCRSSLEISHDLLPNRTKSLTTNIGVVNFTGGEDRRALEDVLSSQNSTESSIFQITERNGSCSDSNSEAEDLVTQSPSKLSDGFDGCTFTELLQMGGSTMFQEFYNCGSGSSAFNLGAKGEQNQSKGMDSDKHGSSMVRIGNLKDSSAHIYPSNSNPPHTQVPISHSSTYRLHMTRDSGILEVQLPEILAEESSSLLPSIASEITETMHAYSTSKQNTVKPETVSETTVQKVPASAQANQPAGLYESSNKHHTQTMYSLQPETYSERNPKSFSHQHRDMTEVFQSEKTMLGEPRSLVHTLVERQKSGMNQVSSSPEFSEVLDVERGCLEYQEKPIENKVIQSNLKEQLYVSGSSATGTTKNLKAKKKEFDWDSLRKKAYADFGKRGSSSNTMDSLDWEAVRCADVNEIASAIKERGMNNMLAERIKDLLNRLVREHGGIDLEWLRDVPPDKAKEYLLSIRGLGLKSVECVRLLTLHHLAFPVDTNVGRIAVRLGWVPLQPLPESLQLHLLEMYPVLESIQKYLWPRLCTLDQRTLYELHYQMITFGKVFCTKSKPNCNACPMRGECKHFASAFASARFALPAPEEKSIVSSTVPVAAEHNPTLGIYNPTVGINPMQLLLPGAEANPLTVTTPENRKENKNCEPIVEVPASPEPECTEISDIEDFLDEDPDEIPTIKLNIEELTMNLQNYMQEYSMELQEGGMSKALVALTPETASIPVPKLKNVSRLRTEHQVYELPDSHPLLKEMDKREPDDPCSYLLAIWTPGETAESIEPPRSSCSSQESDKLCNEKTCFSCNSIREANSQTVRGTLLIPCRTANRGSFPLNGTYFQVNEVFADHDSSLNPIDVPRSWLWNLPRRTVYFGTSIPTIFKGLTTEGIQHCFWRGFVCVRGFDQKTRAPRPLMARLHFPASRLAASRLARTKAKGNEE